MVDMAHDGDDRRARQQMLAGSSSLAVAGRSRRRTPRRGAARWPNSVTISSAVSASIVWLIVAMMPIFISDLMTSAPRSAMRLASSCTVIALGHDDVAHDRLGFGCGLLAARFSRLARAPDGGERAHPLAGARRRAPGTMVSLPAAPAAGDFVAARRRRQRRRAARPLDAGPARPLPRPRVGARAPPPSRRSPRSSRSGSMLDLGARRRLGRRLGLRRLLRLDDRRLPGPHRRAAWPRPRAGAARSSSSAAVAAASSSARRRASSACAAARPPRRRRLRTSSTRLASSRARARARRRSWLAGLGASSAGARCRAAAACAAPRSSLPPAPGAIGALALDLDRHGLGPAMGEGSASPDRRRPSSSARACRGEPGSAASCASARCSSSSTVSLLPIAA